MTERLLQFIWQFQHFNTQELQTTAGERICILQPGRFNTHQGPDFLEARVRIADKLWAGHIELHLVSSGWGRHAHHLDPNYENVILHVVWIDDQEKCRPRIPTLALQDRVRKLLLQQYELWMNSQAFIPCAPYMPAMEEIIWVAWKERLLLERIQRKCLQVEELLRQNNFHWEQTCWVMAARNFGITVNAEAFGETARSIPMSILWKHRNQPHQLEAILFGQAGLLEGIFTDSYPRLLQREYSFYRAKYALEQPGLPVHFLRMRPASFPTIRLAQLAMLVRSWPGLFALVKEAPDISTLKTLLSLEAAGYWYTHFNFDEASAYQRKKMGCRMMDNIIINTFIPLVFTYGQMHRQETYIAKALNWLRQLPAEKNAVTLQFDKLCLPSVSASDTQSLKELKTQYCDLRRCLDCSIGAAIMKRSS